MSSFENSSILLLALLMVPNIAFSQDVVGTSRFERKANGVHDNAQKLIWAEKDNGSPTDWAGAKAYCKSLGAGWELPSAEALQSLYDASGEHSFEWTQAGVELASADNELGAYPLTIKPATSLINLSHCCFWSKDASESAVDGAWHNALMVDLGNAELMSNPVTYADGAQALCVRAGE